SSGRNRPARYTPRGRATASAEEPSRVEKRSLQHTMIAIPRGFSQTRARSGQGVMTRRKESRCQRLDAAGGHASTDHAQQMGAHYTSERDILTLAGSLFLDELRAELTTVQRRRDHRAYERFRDKLAGIHILDPACGRGDFLAVVYRELRLLEFELLR